MTKYGPLRPPSAGKTRSLCRQGVADPSIREPTRWLRVPVLHSPAASSECCPTACAAQRQPKGRTNSTEISGAVCSACPSRRQRSEVCRDPDREQLPGPARRNEDETQTDGRLPGRPAGRRRCAPGARKLALPPPG